MQTKDLRPAWRGVRPRAGALRVAIGLDTGRSATNMSVPVSGFVDDLVGDSIGDSVGDFGGDPIGVAPEPVWAQGAPGMPRVSVLDQNHETNQPLGMPRQHVCKQK